MPSPMPDSAPFIVADGLDAAPYPVDEEGYGEDDPPVEEAAPPAPRRRSARGRLASAPRAAK